jgi:hypothetical protein
MIKRYVFETEQRWLKFREDIFTSSEVNRLMAEPTKKAKEAGKLLSEGSVTYILEKLSAQFEAPKPVYFDNSMQWGQDNEPSAALLLCDLLGLSPQSDDVIYTSEGGKVLFSDGRLGGTPDLILPNSIAEIKCPNSDTHLYYRAFVSASNFKDELPKYYDQMQANMYLCERGFCHFLSYDPRFKGEARQSHLILVKRDQERINQILEKVSIAFDYMQELKTKL